MAQNEQAPIFDDLQALAEMGVDTPEDQAALMDLYRETQQEREATLAHVLGGNTIALVNRDGTLMSPDEAKSVEASQELGAYHNGRRA